FKMLAQMTFHQRLEHHAERVQRRADPGEDQHDREYLPRRAQRAELAEPDRGDRGDRLVDRVKQAESEHDIAEAASGHDSRHRQQRERDAPDSAHLVIVAHPAGSAGAPGSYRVSVRPARTAPRDRRATTAPLSVSGRAGAHSPGSAQTGRPAKRAALTAITI